MTPGVKYVVVEMFPQKVEVERPNSTMPTGLRKRIQVVARSPWHGAVRGRNGVDRDLCSYLSDYIAAGMSRKVFEVDYV